MSPELREALRGLCCGHGWSYGALWRPDRRDPWLLMMEECYYEEQIRSVIDKMHDQVHMVGEGTLGVAAISGKHQWIYSDTCCIDSNPTSPGDKLDMFQSNDEWKHQFIAGIQTIAIISMPSFGVVQFGSFQKIPENLKLADQVQHLFRKLESVTGIFLRLDAYKTMNVPDPPAAFASVIASGDTYSNNGNTNTLHADIGEVHLGNAQFSTSSVQPSSFFSLGSHRGTRPHCGTMNPHALPMPVMSCSTGASKYSNDYINGNSLFHLTDKFQAADGEGEALLSPSSHVRPNSSFPDSSLANYLNATTWAQDIVTQPLMDPRLLSCMKVQGSPSKFSTKSHLSIPHTTTSHCFGGGSSESCSPYGSQGMMLGAKSYGVSKPNCYGAEKMLNFQHSSSSSFPVGDLSTGNSFHIAPSFAPELPRTLITSHDLAPEHSILVHSKDDPINDLIRSSDQPLEQVSDVPIVPVNADMLRVSCVSSSMVGSDAIDCSLMTELPSRLVENSIACAVNSLDTGSDWKANSSNTPTQLLSDNDLFDGMELDLSRRILGQNSWDDIIMSVGSGSCSNLSTSVADCIDVGSIEDADKGLFSESTLEQLLDAVVAGNANLSSSHNSIATNVNSVVSLDSEHQTSKITKSGGPQLCRNQVPLLGHSSLIRTSDMSLPERSLEKIMQGSPKEAFVKSHVSSWIDDSCSMILNTESAVIDHRKKPEEAAKVAKKRARPGESTRPRPKDRQQIQDRVKELREIVPNGAKCSIDSLLDRTIKHMFFLQSVTKYADKLKQADEPKMIGDESGVVLKDNLSGGGGGGATWAYEVAGQTMVCPILVEDLNPPGQMLVEMLCEDRGFFLEIADIIRGFGLTILKGVMEIRDSKIWARFLVEAHRDVTRMDIFLSLVQLLQQASCVRSSDRPSRVVDKGVPAFSNYQQSPAPIPISLADGLN